MDIEAIIRENIGATLHMSLATSKNNAPWVCEVHFAYDDNLNLYFRSKPSRRHSLEIADNPTISGNIVKQHNLDEKVIGLYFEGKAERLKNTKINDVAYKVLCKRLGIKESSIDEAKNTDNGQGDGHVFYKISVKTWYAFGRFGAEHGQKLTLEWNNI